MARLLVLQALALIAWAVQAAPLQLAQSLVASVTAPAVVAVREHLPDLPRAAAPAVHPDAVDLIVRWEVGGQGAYMRQWSGVYYPGGASGPTWGIGYDGGHQTRARIRADWQQHPDVLRLEGTAGISGTAAQQQVARWSDIRTPYAQALGVFRNVSLPDYRAQARRAFGPGFEALPPRAAGALTSLVYNRGSVMTGNARAEMRAIRDRCIPASDTACIAGELRAMCRLWEGTANGHGLCARRRAEADLVGRMP